MAGEQESKIENATISEGTHKDMVTFPAHQDFPSLKLDVEDSSEGMSPRNMWQVYALGGFMILRWVWARWRERKAREGSSESEEPSISDE